MTMRLFDPNQDYDQPTGGGGNPSKLPGSGGNQWFPNLPSMPGGASPGRPAANAGSGSAAAPSNYISPYLINLGEGFGTMSPMSPTLSNNFMGWLTSQVGQGVPGYSGQLSAGPNSLLQSLSSMFKRGPGSLPGMDTLEAIASGKGPGADVLNQFMKGGGPGSDILSRMAQTGMPTDVGPAWEAMKASQQRGIEQGAADLKQQFNFAGGLAGSPFGSAIGDYYNQASKDLNSILAQMSVGAQESARERQMGAADILGTKGLSAADILRGTALSAGGAQAQAGLGFSGQGMQLGQILQSIQQSGLDRQYQEFMRTQPQYNPLLNLMFGGATTYPPILQRQGGGGGGQTAGNILGGAGSILAAMAPFI